MTRKLQITDGLGALALAALLALAPAASAQSYGDTCRYYDNLAFKDRRTAPATTFRMDLAQDCVDATVYARSPNPETRNRAEAYLSVLQDYRREMVAILAERARSRERHADLRRYAEPVVRPVSRAGAYLIARRMGVVSRHEEWTAWRRSAALADPRFRID